MTEESISNPNGIINQDKIKERNDDWLREDEEEKEDSDHHYTYDRGGRRNELNFD